MKCRARCAACEGSLLVVDASQGVEAQTLANVYQAIDNNHEIVVVLNKVDLPAAEPERVKEQVEEVIGLDASNAVEISAKTGLNIEAVLEAIVHQLPPPKEGDASKPLKAMLVDSWYDAYLGVIVLVRVIDGVLKKGQTIRMMGTGAKYPVERTGYFTPKMVQADELGPGEFGFITASIKEVADTRVGDTITEDKRPTPRLCPASSRRSLSSSAACSRSTPPISRTCAQRWANCASTTPRSPMKWKRRPRSASASAAASSAFASGNHPGAAGARVRPRPDRHRAERRLPHRHDRRLGEGAAQPGRHARRGQDRIDRGAVDPRHHPDARRLSRRDPEALPGPPRHSGRPLLCRQARHAAI
jgi:hypothetical protein